MLAAVAAGGARATFTICAHLRVIGVICVTAFSSSASSESSESFAVACALRPSAHPYQRDLFQITRWIRPQERADSNGAVVEIRQLREAAQRHVPFAFEPVGFRRWHDNQRARVLR